MTISSNLRKAGPFAGNAATTAFPFAYKVFTTSDVVVTKSDGVTEATLTLTTDYTVALNPDQNANPGGTVTYPASGSPLPVGQTLTLSSFVPELQQTSITTQGGFYPKIIEDALDRLTIFVQQFREILGRSLRFPVSDPALNITLPTAAQRASKLLGFDASGNVTAVGPYDNTLLAAQLSASSGASLIGYGSTTAAGVFDSVRNIKYYGAKVDGTTDDSAAWAAAVADLNNGLIKGIHQPLGISVVSQSFVITQPRAVLSWAGVGHTCNTLQTSATSDTFIFRPANLTDGSFLNGVTLNNFSVFRLNGATDGRSLTLQDCYSVTMNTPYLGNFVKGIDIAGSNGIIINGIAGFGNSGWTVDQPSAYGILIRKTVSGVAQHMPSEIVINGINLKGQMTGATAHLPFVFHIQQCDGMWVTGGHIGFTYFADVFIEPMADVNGNISDVWFDNIYLDGNFGARGNALNVSGSAASYVGRVYFNDCNAKVHNGDLSISVNAAVDGFGWKGGAISGSGITAVQVIGANDVEIDTYIRDINMTNTANNRGIYLSNVTRAKISCDMFAGTNGGLNAVFTDTGCVGIQVHDCIDNGFTKAYDAVATAKVSYSGNTRGDGTVPTVVSVDTFVLPLGYDLVRMTGSTSFSFVSAPKIDGLAFDILFTGTLTVGSAGHFTLTGGVPANVTPNSIMSFICNGTTFVEKSRSIK